MPMPVSRDLEAQLEPRRPSPAPVPEPAAATSPASVNLTALPTRLNSTCRSRVGSPTTRARQVGRRARRRARCPSAPAPSRSSSTTFARDLGRVEGGRLELDRARLEPRIVENVVDDRQQPLRRVARDAEIARRSRRRSPRCRSSSSMPSTPFIGVRISWLIAARNSDLACARRLGARPGRAQLLVGAGERGGALGHPPLELGVELGQPPLGRLALGDLARQPRVVLLELPRARQREQLRHQRPERDRGRPARPPPSPTLTAASMP